MTTQAVARASAQPRKLPDAIAQEAWRLNGLGLLRIVFGIIWLVDGWFKWQPEFIGKFTDYLTGALEGQPAAVQAWINFWINIVNVDPRILAYVVALGETAIAVGLLFGVFSNLTYLGGTLLSLVIWSTAEGFGGPYAPGSTDIGAAIIYVLVFAGLYLTSSGLYMGLDRRLTPLLGRWGLLASGSLRSNE